MLYLASRRRVLFDRAAYDYMEHRLSAWPLSHAVGLWEPNSRKYDEDVFKLPRPPRDQVWIPEMMSSIDSTAARDFGFPSTHAMNSMSNPLFTILYYYYYRSQEVGSVAMPFWAAIALGILWYLSVTCRACA